MTNLCKNIQSWNTLIYHFSGTNTATVYQEVLNVNMHLLSNWKPGSSHFSVFVEHIGGFSNLSDK